MSYNFLTQWDSPNYTAASQTSSTWGVNREIREICIHWWGDPNTNPSFEGVVGGFLVPGGLSAHYVATGTGRRVACLVSPVDNSWATGPGNPYTISIECDPRARDEDYDTVAELIADIRSAYGQGLTLVPHNKYVVTACPGRYDLNRLNAIANNKISHDAWGTVTDKNPTPAPQTVTAEQVKQAYRDILEREADLGGLNHYLANGMSIDQIRADLMASSEHSILVNNKNAAAQAALEAAKAAAAAQAKLDQERAERDRASNAATAAAQAAAEAARQNTTLLQQILQIVQSILNKITGVFK